MEQGKSKPRDSNIDDLVKSRHPGENRSPENLGSGPLIVDK
jgi:hypothetical protein